MTAAGMEFKEIRFVLNNGVEIIIDKAYILEFTIHHNLGHHLFSLIPGEPTVEIDIRLVAPSAVWSYTSQEEPKELGFPTPLQIESPEE